MTATALILAGALAIAAGRLILWTSLGRLQARASTLLATQDEAGTVEYSLAPLDLACRGDVVVRHAGKSALEQSLLRQLRGLEPPQVVELLRAEGFQADLIPGWRSYGGTPGRGGQVVPAMADWRRRLRVVFAMGRMTWHATSRSGRDVPPGS